MTPATGADEGDSAQNHPAAGLETVVVDPDDVVEAMGRNKRDETEQRSHVLRVTPPLEGEQRASLFVSEAHTRYPPEVDPKPLHLTPEAFLVGHDAGSRHPDYRAGEWSHPDMTVERSRFRDEFDVRDEEGGNRPLTDAEEDEWDEWWELSLEMWEDAVRHALQQTDEITFTSQYPDVEDTTVAVRCESANESESEGN